MVMVASVEVESPACTRSGPPPPLRAVARRGFSRESGRGVRAVRSVATLCNSRHCQLRTSTHRTNKGRKCFVTGINQASQATRNTRKLGTQPNKAIKRPHPSPHLCMWTPYERCVTVGLNGVDRCVGKCMCSRGQGLNSCPGSRVAGHAPEPNGRA